MIGPEIIQWIQEQKAAGQTKSDIYLHLFQQGYQPQEINPALDEAFNGASPAAGSTEPSWLKKNIFLVLSGILFVASAVIFAYFLITQ